MNNNRTRDLLLLRHAKSDWQAVYESDLSRPLSARGRRAARAMGRWMQENQIHQDVIYTSPSTRTRQTLELLAAEIVLADIHVVNDLYHADLDTLLSILSNAPARAQRVMLVGHNPGLEDLLLYLTADDLDETEGKLFPTATLAEIELPHDWQALRSGSGRLRTLVRPRELDLE